MQTDTANTSVTITEPAVLSASTTQIDELCNGGNTGSIDLTVSGGTLLTPIHGAVDKQPKT